MTLIELQEQEFELFMAVMLDSKPLIRLDAAYLVGETIDNAKSVLYRGAELWKCGAVPIIAVQIGGKGFGYCGYDYSQQNLQAMGVPFEDIRPMPILAEFEEKKIVNTLTEMMSLVQLAESRNWQKLYLVAPPFHQLRSFITVVTAIDNVGAKLKVYNCVGTSLSWKEKVVHSQGVLTGTRIDLFKGEIQRIRMYQNSRMQMPLVPLVSCERALEYLNERDAA